MLLYTHFSGLLRVLFRCSMLVFLTFSCTSAFSQEYSSFRIENPGDYDVELLADAFESPAWDACRKVDEENQIEFKNGAIVSLFSVNTLESAGIPVDATKALPDSTPESTKRIFELHSSGIVVERRTATIHKRK